MSYTTSFNQGGELLEGTLLPLLLHLTYPAPPHLPCSFGHYKGNKSSTAPTHVPHLACLFEETWGEHSFPYALHCLEVVHHIMSLGRQPIRNGTPE